MKQWILLLLLLSTPVYATTYYVTKTGSGTACTIGSPCLTIATGLTKLSPGDTLDVAAGTYAERLVESIPTGTSEGARIIIKAHSGDTPILRPGAGNRVIEIGNSDYVTIDGFDIDAVNCTYDAVKIFSGTVSGTVYDAHHIKITNCIVRNSKVQGIIFVAQGPNTPVGYNEVSYTTIHTGGCSTLPPTVQSTQCNSLDNAIYWQTPNGTITHNTIYNWAGAGVQIYNGYSVSFAANNTVSYNIVHDEYDNVQDKGQGIILSSGTNNVAYNNIVYGIVGTGGGSAGILVYSGSGHKVYNNTVYNTAGPGIMVEASNNTIRNNIMSTSNPSGDIGSGNTWSNNLCSAADTGCLPVTEASGSTFTNAGSADFTLKAASRAIETGFDLSAVFTTDYAGNTRKNGTTTGSAFDVGAYEYISPPNSLTLLSPNGGESWQIGTTQTITWATVAAGATVELTADLDGNGSYETSIDASTPNDGTYDWVVAGSANSSCKIKVKDTAAATNDVSDAVFALTAATVTGTITIVTPAASATYNKGTSVIISWTSTDVNGNVTIELSRNSGNTWETIGTYAYNASDVVYTATTPSSSACKIKITSVNDTNVTATSSAFRLGGRIM